jgi:acyl-CoA reductase-like NAD-dependent aldehyde dehydrogenase
VNQTDHSKGNMGQVCTATSRLYVQDTIYDQFLEAFKKQTKENTSIGSQFSASTTHGPQISHAAQQKILSYIDVAKSEGATLIHGGTQSGLPEKGYFVEPTVFANCNNDMQIVKEEIFGPFVVIQSFKTEEEVLEKANDSEFGLGAAVFTRDIMRGHRVAGGIEAGMVWVSNILGGDSGRGTATKASEHAANICYRSTVRKTRILGFRLGGTNRVVLDGNLEHMRFRRIRRSRLCMLI